MVSLSERNVQIKLRNYEKRSSHRYTSEWQDEFHQSKCLEKDGLRQPKIKYNMAIYRRSDMETGAKVTPDGMAYGVWKNIRLG